jgi:glycosyltransferase involved in cell wall biosynthesis
VTPVIGKIANYGSWKGQDVVLEAAAMLKREGRKLVFLFAGRDTDSDVLRRKAAGLGLGPDEARFLGFRGDVPRLLSLLRVSVNAATEGEGLSGALRESLAMGVPVVASDAGGNRELVEDGVTGRLVAANDPAALARAVAALVDAPAGASRLAEAGRKKVVERFGSERVSSEIAAFYRSLLARRRGREASRGSRADQAASTSMSRQDSQEAETTL